MQGTEQDPRTITSLFIAEGDQAAEHMARLTADARNIGGITMMPVTGISGEWFQLPEAELARHRELDQSVSHVLDTLPPPTPWRSRLTNELWSRGVRTARDVFVLGRDGALYGQGTKPVISTERFSRLENALQTVFPNIELHDRPTASYIGSLCFSLDQVHAGVLPSYLPECYHHRRKDIQGTLRADLLRSVGEVVAQPMLTPTALSPEAFQRCKVEAYRFAAEFTTARLQQGAQSPP
jgi:hypothetical protein